MPVPIQAGYRIAMPKYQRDKARIGARIRRWRQRAKMTEAEFALRVGVNEATIRRYEAGMIPNGVVWIKRMEDALGARRGEFLGGEA